MMKLPYSILLAVLSLASSPQAGAQTDVLPNLGGLHIALDVGHSQAAGGALSARGRFEFEFNQATARTIATVLRTAGAKVTIINENGDMTGLAERPITAVRIGADAFLSIHHDSANDKYMKTWVTDGTPRPYCDQFSGYSVFCSKDNWKASQSRTLAKQVGAAMLGAGFKPTPHHHEAIPGENRPFIDEATGVYEFTELVVVRSAKLPSVLLECGVIVNRDEELLVQTEAYQKRIGMAVANGLAAAKEQGIFKRFPWFWSR